MICKIVPLCVLMPIHRVVARRSITSSKSSKQMRPLQHIDIIESIRHTKKQCQIHKSSDATASSTIVASRDLRQYCPCHAFGQFFKSNACNQRLLPCRANLASHLLPSTFLCLPRWLHEDRQDQRRE
jgi:hypothetical protein